MTDYNELKRNTLSAVQTVGLLCVTPSHIAWMTGEQRRRLMGKNLVTDEKWQFRFVRDRSIVVEISYGWMMGGPVWGLTCFHRDEPDRDFDRSGAHHSLEDLMDALTALDAVEELAC